MEQGVKIKQQDMGTHKDKNLEQMHHHRTPVIERQGQRNSTGTVL